MYNFCIAISVKINYVIPNESLVHKYNFRHLYFSSFYVQSNKDFLDNIQNSNYKKAFNIHKAF